MTCAICLTTFWLICLFQAEHVHCLWATQAQGSERQSGNAYDGFSRQDSGLRRDGGSNLQNKFRQASFSPSSAQSSSLKGLGESSSVLSLNWRRMDSRRVVGLSTSIASGSAMSHHIQEENSLNDRTRPTQQGAQRTNQYLSRNSASAQSPTFSAQAGYPPASQTSSLFSAGAPVPEHSSIRKHTSASVRGQRVSSKSKAAASKPSSFSLSQNERMRKDPSQTDQFRSQLFTATGGSAKGVYAPASSSQSAFAPRSLGGSQGNYDPSSTSAEMPSQTRAASLLWITGNQGDDGLRDSSQQFAPSDTFSIPHRFGGSPIRRLRGPSDQKQVVQTPQLKYTAPSQQTASYKPQGQRVPPEGKWKGVSRLHQ